MQPQDTTQENGEVAQQPQKQPQQQEVRIQCPYTASSCPLFNPTFSVAEVLAAGSSAPPPPPSPPPKKQPTPLVPLAPPTHPSLVDSMRSACGVGVGAGGMEGEGAAAGFAYTDYSIAPSPETLTRSLGSSTSGSGRGSGSPPSLASSALYAPPPPPSAYPSKHSPSTYTPLPFNTPSGFRLPSPETPFSPLSALEAAAFASGGAGGAYNTYPSPRSSFASFGTGSYGGPLSPYAGPSAGASSSYRLDHSSLLPPPPPPPPSSARPLPSSSRPIGLGFSAPTLDSSGLPMPMPVADLAGLEGLEGLASAAAAAAAQAGVGVGVGGMVGGEMGRPRKRKRTGTSESGDAQAEDEEEEGFASASVGGAVASTSAAAVAGPSAPTQPMGAEVATPFISKLHHLLSNPSYADVIRWSRTGTSLLYSHTSPRLLEVLKRFFRHTAISSLARQLNIYCFRRLSTNEVLEELREGEKASEWTGFAHEGFWREGEGRERCVLERLKPRAVKKKGEAGGGGGGKKRKKVAPAGGRKAEVLTDEEGNGEE